MTVWKFRSVYIKTNYNVLFWKKRNLSGVICCCYLFILPCFEIVLAPNCSVPVLENGNVTFSSEYIAETGIVLAGTTVEFRCNWRYRLNGLPTHRCDDSGTWTYITEPTCTGKCLYKDCDASKQNIS